VVACRRANKTVVEFTPIRPRRTPALHVKQVPLRLRFLRISQQNASSSKPALNAVPAPGFTPTSGEVLEFTSSVAKVNNVASLRLVVAGAKK